MSIMRSSFNGIGTGAGVAWPLFGIVASVFSLSAGSALTFNLAILCTGLFFSISIVVFYISYKKYKEEENKLNEKLCTYLINFIKSAQESVRYSTTVESHSNDPQSENTVRAAYILNYLLNEHNQDLGAFLTSSFHLSKRNIHQIYSKLLKQEDLKGLFNSLTWEEKIVTAFTHFVSAFGSIAGCSAGVMGVLVTTEVIAGFSSVPLLGVSLLLTASCLGIYSALNSVRELEETSLKKSVYKSLKQLNLEPKTPPQEKLNRSKDLITLEVPELPVKFHAIHNVIFLSQFRGSIFYKKDKKLQPLPQPLDYFQDSSSSQPSYK